MEPVVPVPGPLSEAIEGSIKFPEAGAIWVLNIYLPLKRVTLEERRTNIESGDLPLIVGNLR